MREAKATLFETNQQFLSHTSQHIAFSMPFLGVVSDLATFQIAFFIPHSNPCSHLGVVSALFQNCVLRLLCCVWRDVRVLGAGRNFVWGGGGMRVGCSQLQQQIPTFSLCFWPCFAEWCFLSFSKVGGGGGCFNSTIWEAEIILGSWLFDRQLWIES